MPRTRSSRGAVELPLTYVYAVLIGIVVFIVATRVVGIQSQSVANENQQRVLTYFDSIIEQFGQNPNTIANLSIPNMKVKLSWDRGSRIIVGSSSALIRFDTFSAPTLSQRIIGWSYPFSVEASSGPLLLLSDGTIEYRIVSDGSSGGANTAQALKNQEPIDAATYGLTITQASAPRGNTVTGATSQRALCIVSNPSDQLVLNAPNNGCDLVWYTNKAPYGYLTFNEKRWYPTYSYGQVFAGLFAADEAAWNSTIAHAEARDWIARQLLTDRAKKLKDEYASTNGCPSTYGDSVTRLGAINSTINSLVSKESPAPRPMALDLSVFNPIGTNIMKLKQNDRTLIQDGCPAVIS